jgi:hypothetical protein
VRDENLSHAVGPSITVDCMIACVVACPSVVPSHASVTMNAFDASVHAWVKGSPNCSGGQLACQKLHVWTSRGVMACFYDRFLSQK